MPSSNLARKLPDEPIVIVSFAEFDPDPLRSESLDLQIAAFLDTVSTPVFLVLDMTGHSQSLDDMVLGFAEAIRGDNPVLKHPNLREIVQVASDMVFERVAEGMDNELFGNIKVRSFDTLEDALAYARATR